MDTMNFSDIFGDAIPTKVKASPHSPGLFLDCEIWSYSSPHAEVRVLHNPATSVALMITMRDLVNDRAYRFESIRGVTKIAPESIRPLDDSTFYELEIWEDCVEKMQGIWGNQSYDERIQIQLRMTDEEAALLTAAAESLGVTVDEFVNISLREAIEREKVNQ